MGLPIPEDRGRYDPLIKRLSNQSPATAIFEVGGQIFMAQRRS
jgi:hypothetical protein